MRKIAPQKMKIFNHLTVSTIILSLITQTTFAAALPKAKYTDVPLTNFSQYENPFQDTHILMLEGKAAAELYRRGITNGYDDHTFKGYREINRAEVAKFLITARYNEIYETEGTNTLEDVKSWHWFYPYVRMANSKGIVTGYKDNTFRAGNTINTAEFLKMLAKTFDIPDKLPHNYKDIEPAAWYAPLAGIAATYKLFPEREDKLDPGRNLTRTEVAIALYNYFLNRNTELPEKITTSKEKIKGAFYPHHKLGIADAKVAIDIYGSLEEPNTRTLMKTLKQIQNDYKDNVKLIWNYFPQSSYNLTEYKTANAIECAGDQEKFWEYLDIVLSQDSSAFGSALYLNAASQLELNMKKFEICLEEEPYLSRIQYDKEEATSQGFTSIPTMYINGKPHTGAKSYNYIEEIVKSLL